MLLLLPPSEGKTPPVTGTRLDLGTLLGGQVLTRSRREVMADLTRVSTSPQAAGILGLGPRSIEDVGLNLALESSPCAPAHDLYTGVLFEAARLRELGARENSQAVLHRHVVIMSGLWGALRGTDPVPNHRLSMGCTLPGAGRLISFWRAPLSEAIAPAAAGVVVDCRSGAYSPAWQPRPEDGTELLRVKPLTQGPDGARRTVSHWAKHARGLLTGALVRALADGSLRPEGSVQDVAETAQGLDGVTAVELGRSDRAGRRDLLLLLG